MVSPLVEHDLVEGVKAGLALHELLGGCERAVHEDLAARGAVRERDLFVGAEKAHRVHAGHSAAAQGVHADLVLVARAAHALAPIDGAVETLKALKEGGYKLAMATSKPGFFASQISKKFGFSEYFDEEVGSGLDEKTLPTKSDVIAEAIKRLGVKKEECLMVGDRKHDAEGAKNNGVDCALLKIGYAENEEEFVLANPEYVFEDLYALKDFLLK